MANRDDFIQALEAVDARLEALSERILANGDAPLKEGTWRVRDALSHLAARSNGVSRVLARLDAPPRPAGGGDQPPRPPRSVDEINAGQVEERVGRSVRELLDEIREGHRTAIETIRGVEEEKLARELPWGFRPGEAPVADLMIAGGPRHDNGHIDQIEAALEP